MKPTNLRETGNLSLCGVFMNVKVIVERGEDGYFVAHIPSLKGCWSQGKTKEEALQNIREAIDLYLEPDSTELTEDQEIVELAV
jgi:predicted RNase H-like HicB family nuclease